MNASAQIAEIKREVSAIKAAQAIAAGTLRVYNYSGTIDPLNDYYYRLATITFTPDADAANVYAVATFSATHGPSQDSNISTTISTRSGNTFIFYGIYISSGGTLTGSLRASAPGAFSFQRRDLPL